MFRLTNMIISNETIEKVLGQQRQVVIYGASKSHYNREIAQSLVQQGYELYDFMGGLTAYSSFYNDSLGLADHEYSLTSKLYDRDIAGKTREGFKSVITNLVIMNYQLKQEGKPLVPLLFCIGFESDQYEVNFKCDMEAMVNGEFQTSKEIRRCYKIYSELGEVMREIAEQTFKFVAVYADQNTQNVHHLKPLPLVWQNTEWKRLWDVRSRNKLFGKHQTEKSNWRETLFKKIADSTPKKEPVRKHKKVKI